MTSPIQTIKAALAAKVPKAHPNLEALNVVTALRAYADTRDAALLEAVAALEEAQEQLAVGRRFLPSHGSFGEDGISDYQGAQKTVVRTLTRIAEMLGDSKPTSNA